MARKQLYINGVGTGDYGIYISSDTYLNAPAPDITAHSVPARNGDLIQWNKRLNNIVRKFTCYIPSDAQSNFDGFKKLLYSQIGYMEISSDYETDTYQRGYLADEIEAEPFQKDENLTVTFELYFSCEPQKYFKETMTNTDNVYQKSNTPGMSVILPRSHPYIQNVLKQIPTQDVPTADCFVIFKATESTVIGGGIPWKNFQFSMPSYDGFVAMLTGSLQSVMYANRANTDTFVVYSTHGQIDSDISITPTGGGVLLVMLPADVVGTFTASAIWTISGTDNEMAFSYTMQYFMTVANEYGVGVQYNIEIQGYYENTSAVQYQSSDLNNTIYVFGRTSGKKTFSAVISYDSSLLPKDGERHSYSLLIDSGNYDFKIRDDDTDTVMNVNSYIDVIGEIDGIADEINIIIYRANYERGYPFSWSPFTLETRWWKI